MPETPGESSGRKVGKKSPPLPQGGRNVSKRVKSSGSANPEYAEAGIITKINLKNFLCHKNFTIHLAPNINFINGVNGSGKSAILAAIQTCLGSRASQTQRAASMKDLIRHNQEWAICEVTLKNEGTDAFSPQDFGTRIIIERHIWATGRNAEYQVKNAEGKLVSKKREILDRILNHFNIQVTNPCVLLTQDDSRALIGTKDARQKYDFFLRATALDQMQDSLKVIQGNIKTSERTMEIDTKRVNDLKLKKVAAEKEHKASLYIRELDTRLLKERENLMWAAAIEKEAEVAEVEHHLKKIIDKIQKHKDRLDPSQNLDSKALVREMHEALAEHKQSRKDTRENENKIKQKLKENREADRMQSRNVAKAKKKIKKYNTRKRDLEKDMKELMNTSARDVEEVKRQKNIETATKELERLRSKMIERQQVLEDLRNNPDKSGQEIDVVKAKSRQAERDEQHLKTRLRRLQASRGNRLASFGQHCQGVDNELKRCHREFKVPPRGPLGKYVKVRSDNPDAQKWLLAIEVNIRSIAKAYLCDNAQDSSRLSAILKKFYGNSTPMIIQRSSRAPKHSIPNPRRGAPTRVIDLIDIEDPWVFNTFIDKCACEDWLVHEDGRFAHSYVLKNRVRGMLLPDGTTVRKRGVGGVFREGNRHQRSQYLRVDHGAERRACQEELNEIQMKTQEHRKRLTELQKLKRKYEKKLKDAETIVMKTDYSISQQEQELEKLSQEANLESDMSGEIEAIRDEIDQQEALIKEALENQNKWDAECNAVREEHGKYSAELTALRKKWDEIGTTMEGIKVEYTDKIHKLAKVRMYQDRAKQAIDKYTKTLKDKEAELKIKQEEFEKYEEAAKKLVNERPDRLSSSSTIASRVKGIEKHIEREKKKHGDPYIAEKNLEKATAALNAAEDDVRDSLLAIRELNMSFSSRKNNWKSFRNSLTKSTSFFFNQQLAAQGHSGCIKFDHKEKKLELQVVPASSQVLESTTTKALSGGEKSFTTIAFVMALGASLVSPFRAMDEFDIFMDSVNRKVSMDLLIKLASLNKQYQFIFLTPQDINGIEQKSNIKVHKLEAVVRGQQSLNISRD